MDEQLSNKLDAISRDLGHLKRDYAVLAERYTRLSTDFHSWRDANQMEKKGFYQRLGILEQQAIFIPNKEEAALLMEAAAFYRAKRQFREKLIESLTTKGVLGFAWVLVSLSVAYVAIKTGWTT